MENGLPTGAGSRYESKSPGIEFRPAAIREEPPGRFFKGG